MNDGRRQFLRSSFEGLAAAGLGTAALGSLIGHRAAAAAGPAGGAGQADAPTLNGVLQGIHHPAKAKRVIFLFMAGCAEPDGLV